MAEDARVPWGRGGGCHGVACGLCSPSVPGLLRHGHGAPAAVCGDGVTQRQAVPDTSHMPSHLLGAGPAPSLCSFCTEVMLCSVAPMFLGEAGLCLEGTRCFRGGLLSPAPPAATVPAALRAAALNLPVLGQGGSSPDVPVQSRALFGRCTRGGVWSLGTGTCSSCLWDAAVGTAVALCLLPPHPCTPV